MIVLKYVVLLLVMFGPALFALGAYVYFARKHRFVRPKTGRELDDALDWYERRRSR